MTSLRRGFSIGALLFLATASLAHAHPGHEGHELTWDFAAGFFHPLSGFDHALVAVAVGWWAAQLAGRARWVVPLVFASAMIGAAALAPHVAVAGISQAALAGLLLSALAVAFGFRLPFAMAVLGAIVLGVAEGLAHGPLIAFGRGSFLAGFGAGTLVLLATGVGVGALAARIGRRGDMIARAALLAVSAVALAR
jgi:urease accessory protein